MNENSSKQVLLSVLGIAVLVVAVVGVSFAFFTYSKSGTMNNQLTTGSIFFNFSEGDAIYLTNQFPVDDTAGEALTAGSGENAVLSFEVEGYDTSRKGITYTVTAIEGTPEVDKTRFKDDEIKLLLTDSNAVTNNYESAAVVGTAGSLVNGVVLATGTITANSSDAQQTDTYELRMWISSDVVSIDETETAGDGDHVYTSAEYANLYYSLKVKVEAQTPTS